MHRADLIYTIGAILGLLRIEFLEQAVAAILGNRSSCDSNMAVGQSVFDKVYSHNKVEKTGGTGGIGLKRCLSVLGEDKCSKQTRVHSANWTPAERRAGQGVWFSMLPSRLPRTPGREGSVDKWVTSGVSWFISSRRNSECFKPHSSLGIHVIPECSEECPGVLRRACEGSITCDHL